MAFDLKTLAPIVGAFAPMAGSIIGGLIPFPGASMIGQKFGEILARQLGVEPTTAAVSEKLALMTEETKQKAIQAALDKARAEIQGFVDIEKAYLDAIKSTTHDVNVTMQMAKGHWFFTGWRAALGWVFVIFAALYGCVLLTAMTISVWKSGTPLQTLSDAWPLLLSYFAVLGAAVGVYIPSRTSEKNAAMQNNTLATGAKSVVKPNAVPFFKTGGPVNPKLPPARPSVVPVGGFEPGRPE